MVNSQISHCSCKANSWGSLHPWTWDGWKGMFCIYVILPAGAYMHRSWNILLPWNWLAVFNSQAAIWYIAIVKDNLTGLAVHFMTAAQNWQPSPVHTHFIHTHFIHTYIHTLCICSYMHGLNVCCACACWSVCMCTVEPLTSSSDYRPTLL